MQKDSSYQKTLDYLYAQLPMFQRVGQAAFKKDLTNIIKLTKSLGGPQDNYPTIHIAGTNGKGTTAHLLSAILQKSGYRVGLYTSPHYIDFRERIKVDGQLASKQFVVDFVAKHKSVLEEISPSFFEITVAMAFEYFRLQNVDIAIIETGLGGRLDSTNIIQPILSVITNISLDHQQFLGDTLPLIAVEKAGIIKSQIPIVIGEYQSVVFPIFEKIANQRNAPLVCAEHMHQTKFNISKDNIFRCVISEDEKEIYNLETDLRGPFQAKNINTAIACLPYLEKLFPNIDDNSIRTGLKNVKKIAGYQGRWQILGQNPQIICDSAHNEAGLELVMDSLAQCKYDKLHIILGMVNDKSHEHVLSYFPINATYYFAKANIPRGLDADVLKEKASKLGLIGSSYSSVHQAFVAAKKSATTEDLIFVGGSIFVVAEVL